MNRVLLTGRLTRDPEMRKLATGKTVTQFSVATNDYRGGAEKAEYHVKGKVCGPRLQARARPTLNYTPIAAATSGHVRSSTPSRRRR